MARMLPFEVYRKQNRILTPEEYSERKRPNSEFTFFKVMGPIIGILFFLALAIKGIWIDRAAESVWNKSVLTLLFILIGVGIGFLILLPLGCLLAFIFTKISDRRYKRKCEAYEKEYAVKHKDYTAQYNQQIAQVSLQYANSKLVQEAADRITSFFFRKGIRPEKRPTDQKQVFSSITFEVTCDTISCGCNDRTIGAGWSIESIERLKNDSPRLYNAWLDQYETLNIHFTGDGWRFEEMHDKVMMDAVAWAIGEAVRIRVLKKAAELSTEKDPTCWFEKKDDAEITVFYSAENNNFVPTRKI